MILLLQEAIPTVSLGPAGTIILTILAAVLSIITWRQRTWKSTASAAVTEMRIHRESAGRLRTDNVDLQKRLEKLETQTDLRPLIDAITSWVAEGRVRFDDAKSHLVKNAERLNVIHAETAALLQGLLEEAKAQREVSEVSYRTLTQAFIDHTAEDRTVALESQKIHLRLLSMLGQIEQRMSRVEVRAGVRKHQKVVVASEVS